GCRYGLGRACDHNRLTHRTDLDLKQVQLVAERIEAAGRLPQAARPHRARMRALLRPGELDSPAEVWRNLAFTRTRQLVRRGIPAGRRRARPGHLGDARSAGGHLMRVDDHVLVAQAEPGAARTALTRTIHVAEVGLAHDAADERDRTRLVVLCGGLRDRGARRHRNAEHGTPN